MKTLTLVLIVMLATTMSNAQSSGGPYRITSTVVAGGGGSSTGSGNKRIDSTAGQSAAGGPYSSGPKSHDSGFWPTTLAEIPQQGGQTTFQFSAFNFSTQEDLGALAITVTRSGDSSSTASVNYTTNDGVAKQKGDFEFTAGTLTFAPGETTKSFLVLINEDMFLDFNETFSVSLNNPVGAVLGPQSTATITVSDDSPESPTNPIDDAQSFVYMQYHDFLNREPDAAGLAFWTNEITSCGNNATCIDAKRVHVSAAFFLSIEFQETGYLIHRTYKAAYGLIAGTPVPVLFTDFMRDSQQISRGVIVNQAGWQQILEANKQSFFQSFVKTESFGLEHPAIQSPAQFANTLFGNANVAPSPAEFQAVIDEFGGAANTIDVAARARALRRVAENSALAQQELNRAFVLMQYFGYLRRSPNEAPEPALNFDGYNFWLNKLNQFNGSYENAEMVKAFIVSGEYRQRFGQ